METLASQQMEAAVKGGEARLKRAQALICCPAAGTTWRSSSRPLYGRWRLPSPPVDGLSDPGTSFTSTVRVTPTRSE